MARALITGANGFIGANLAEQLLQRGDEVTALVRRTSNLAGLAGLNVTTVQGDVSEVDSLRRAVRDHDVVYHLAGLTKALRPRDLLKTNVDGTKNIGLACQSVANPPTLIHVSSLAAAGPAIENEPRDETQSTNPVSNYGRSKLKSEEAIQDFAKRVPITIVRPPIVFGPADTEFSQVMGPIKQLGVHVIPGMATKYFSMVHVEDLSSMLLAAADRGERLSVNEPTDANTGDGIYFVESERRLSFGEFGAIAGSAMGKKVWRIHVPHALIWIAATASQLALRPFGSIPSFNIDKAREATAGSWICSCEKAKSQLGFATGRPLEERIRETVACYVSKS